MRNLLQICWKSEIVAEAVEATSAGLLGGVAVGVIGAAAMIAATIGMNKLLSYLSKKKRVFKEKDDDPWMGYVGYFVIGKIWYPMIVDLVSHDHKIVTLEWKDMTGFTRHTNVKRSSVKAWRNQDLAIIYPTHAYGF